MVSDQPQPGSLFQRLREAEKRDPGNEVAISSHCVWVVSVVGSAAEWLRHATRNLETLVPFLADSHCLLKISKYEIQEPSPFYATLFRCKFWGNISCFSPCMINLLHNKNICCELKKVVAKVRARVYFEQ